MKNYYETLKNNYRNDYLTKEPTKAGALASAIIAGDVTILNDSNNRALKIETPDAVYLQSYDTLILKYDKNAGVISKLWDGFSVTTLKHINIFMKEYTLCVNYFNKKQWTAFDCMEV